MQAFQRKLLPIIFIVYALIFSCAEHEDDPVYSGISTKIQRANLDGSDIETLLTTELWAVGGFSLDVAGNKMYWANEVAHKIQRANLDGSDIEDLVTTTRWPLYIALDTVGGKIYWTSADKIQRANLDGSNVEVLVATDRAATNQLERPGVLTLDVENGKVYWMVEVEAGGGDPVWLRIQRANLDGSNVEDLVAMENWYSPILIVASNKIYWTDDDKIRRANLDGSNAEDLIIEELITPRDFALDLTDGKIYWLIPERHPPGSSKIPDKIRRANLDGSNAEDLIIEKLVTPWHLALDVTGGKIYWGGMIYQLSGNVGKFQRANLDGSNVETLLTTELGAIYSMTLDVKNGKIYWRVRIE